MKTVSESDILREFIGDLVTESPVGFGGLTVVPLLKADATDPNWLVLEEAIATGVLTVTEVSPEGSVPTLRVVNAGERSVLLLDGEELIGAKQNRILNASILIGAGRSVVIPVSCTEHGRWAYRSRRLAFSGRSLYASVRGKKAAQVYESLRGGRGHRSDQAEIWADLVKKAGAYGVQSPTDAMSDVFEARSDRIEEYRQAFEPLAGQVGAIVYGGSRWWGLELLPGPTLFRKAWSRLLPGYAMDALLVEEKETPTESPADRIGAVLAGPLEVYPAVGMGEDYRFRADGLLGAALVAEGRLAHLMAFPV